MASARERSKKNLETLYLERFLELKGWRCSIIARESPDFLLKGEEGTVGLEVTRLFKDTDEGGSALKEAEVRRSRFLLNLARSYYLANGRPLLLKAILQKVPADQLIPVLVARLKSERPDVTWKRAEVNVSERGRPVAKFFLTSIPDELIGYDKWLSIGDAVGWMHTATPESLTTRILEKASRLPEYKKAVDQVVLLIVADRIKNSGKIHFQSDEKLDSAGFSEVHFLSFPDETCRVA
jgi:hypothetical protein